MLLFIFISRLTSERLASPHSCLSNPESLCPLPLLRQPSHPLPPPCRCHCLCHPFLHYASPHLHPPARRVPPHVWGGSSRGGGAGGAVAWGGEGERRNGKRVLWKGGKGCKGMEEQQKGGGGKGAAGGSEEVCGHHSCSGLGGEMVAKV